MNMNAPSHTETVGNETLTQANMVMQSIHNMAMTFNIRLPFKLLFDDVKLQSKADLAMACILLMLLGVLYEFIKYTRLRIIDPDNKIPSCCGCNARSQPHQYEIELQEDKTMKVSIGDCSTSEITDESIMTTYSKNETSGQITKHFVDTGFHALQLFISYFIMLAVMTYNVYIVICIITGCTLGYFIVNLPSAPRGNRKWNKNSLRQTECHAA